VRPEARSENRSPHYSGTVDEMKSDNCSSSEEDWDQLSSNCSYIEGVQSNTDVLSPVPHRNKRNCVFRIVINIGIADLRSPKSVRSHAEGAENSNSHQNDRSDAPEDGGNRRDQGIKRGAEDGQHPGRDDDKDSDDSNKRGRYQKHTYKVVQNRAKFACPFYKRDPEKYQISRGCPGPGWESVHRLK
jgi:hypothetical protein